jgi:glycosyltransferase involved in cell wall biosynthesis
MKKIFIIPFELPWDWTADYQKQTIKQLKKMGHQSIAYMNRDAVFFLNKKRVVYPKIKNVSFFQPIYIIPFQRFSLVRSINQFLNLIFLKIKFWNKKMYFWSFDPDFYKMIYFSNFLKIKTVYDCVDYHSHAQKNIKRIIKNLENKTISSVKYFFVNSKELFKIHKKTRTADKVVPQGFDLDLFSKKVKPLSILKNNKKPIIGYVGGINYRLDYDLLIELAKKNKEWQFVFWGPIQNQDNDQLINIKEKQKDLFSLKNVYTNKSLKEMIPAVIKNFDVCIIPYNNKFDFNLHSYPMKIFEYFYLKKPVISSEINELKNFSKDLVSTAKYYQDWKIKITNKLNIEETNKVKKTKRDLSIKNSWKDKIEYILNKIN